MMMSDQDLARELRARDGELRESERTLLESLEAFVREGRPASPVVRDLGDGLLEAARRRALVRPDGTLTEGVVGVVGEAEGAGRAPAWKNNEPTSGTRAAL
jgi:hypothetical protein